MVSSRTNTFNLNVVWNKAIIQRCTYLAPYTVHAISYIGPFGLTLQVALLFDLISVATAPLHLSYLMTTAVFRRMVVLALSLFTLFRGDFYAMSYCGS